jgi:DeoR/GlpR family transcriptional regulator of sugar metabolism
MASQMLAEERRSRVLELIRARGFASLPDLVDALKVSESTARRDLDYLEKMGAARRTHGGAFYTGPSPKVPHFDLRQSGEWDKKRQIAAAAARLIQDGDTVLLDGGSTTYELARALVGKTVQIVTNSLPVATLFSGNENVDLVLVGGSVHNRTGVLLGPYATRMLAELHVQRAFLSVAGINERGYYNSNLLLVEAERAMMDAADQVMILADSSKFGRTSLSRLCELGAIDTLVTDSAIGDPWKRVVAEAGVRLLVAGQDAGNGPAS